MAAPTAKYHSNDIKWSKSGYTSKVVQLALRGEYSSLSDAQLRAKFKLDKLRPSVKGSDSVFSGAINTSQDNARFHNASRISIVKIGNYTFLTDAGLNRKGEIIITKILNTDATSPDQSLENYPALPGDVRVFYMIYSPIYNPVTAASIEMLREGSTTIWDTVASFAAMTADQTVTYYFDNPAGITEAGLHTFRARVTNDEGEYLSDNFIVDLQYIAETFSYDNDSASEAESGADRTVYRNTLEIIAYDNGANSNATSFYKLVSGSYVQADAGYYVLNDTWYQYGYNATIDRYCVLDKGLCQAGGYPPGDPGNIIYTYGQVDCAGFDRDDIETARWEVNSGNYDYNTLYLETITDYNNNTTTVYAYSDSGHTTLRGQGYYVAGNMVEGIERELEIDASGIVVNDIIY